jgi:DNA-binding NarL/FixJ family response regulator
MPRDELINAVRAVGLGTTVLDPAVSTRLAGANTLTEAAGTPRLTLREQEVVSLVAEGLSNKAIAVRLGVSTRTVEGHVNHVFTKLDLESRTELVRYVLTNGLPAGVQRPHEG